MLKLLNKIHLAIAIVLTGVTTSVAQTVTVPSNCRVVVTGTGGTLGLGGKVGDGGMVSMPDPSGGGTFTFNPPAGVTTASWNLKGDLSDATATTANGSPIQPPVGLQANIITYNKLLRPSSTETTNPSYARSKGQVKLGYSLTGCGNSITFDVFKTFATALPVIVGPSCLKPNTTYTYSVDRIVSDNTNDNIGFDSYYWSGIPSTIITSGTFYTSADNSSITFTTSATVAPFTLQCCYGRVNPNTADGGISTVNIGGAHTTCVSTNLLLVAPLAPNYSVTPPTCVPTGTVASPAIFTVVYPNVVAGQTYTWTAANTGWLDNGTASTVFTPVVNTTTGNTTLTINTAGNNNPGELTLTITGSCDPAIFKYQINRSITAPLLIVPTGATTTCIASTSTGNTYTLSPTTSNSIVWSISSTTLTGITLANATSSTVTVNTAGTAAGSFTLNATSANASCNNTSVSTTINVKPATPIFTTSTPSCVVKSPTAQITTISVTPTGGVGTYSWNYPTGVTCANCTTSNPTFVLNSTGTSAIITATAIGSNSCNSTPVSKTINYIAVATNFQAGFDNQYAVSNLCGAVTSWVIGTASGTTTYTTSSANITITGANNNNLTISGTTGETITSVCANLIGGIQVCAASVGTNTQRQASTPVKGNAKVLIENIIISPNPNSGNFNIKVGDYSESASATLTDFSGNEIQTYQLRKGENKIDKEGLKKGTYFVILKVDGKQETRQIIVK